MTVFCHRQNGAIIGADECLEAQERGCACGQAELTLVELRAAAKPQDGDEYDERAEKAALRRRLEQLVAAAAPVIAPKSSSDADLSHERPRSVITRAPRRRARRSAFQLRQERMRRALCDAFAQALVDAFGPRKAP